MTELYDELRAAGVRIDHHESDLYCPATETSREIIARYPKHAMTTSLFIDQSGQKGERVWFDIPFAYAPWWRARKL